VKNHENSAMMKENGRFQTISEHCATRLVYLSKEAFGGAG
jgi:hypothetical protein